MGRMGLRCVLPNGLAWWLGRVVGCDGRRHLVTPSPCHLVTLSPCHLVTPSPCHPGDRALKLWSRLQEGALSTWWIHLVRENEC